DWTPQILDILAEHGAVATFFVLGWKVDAHPDLARRIVEEGHSLQSHAYRHHDLPAKSSATVARLIADTATAIQAATGTTPVCLRPPGGGVSGRVRGIAADHGQVVVLWDARGNSGDYASHSSSTVLRRAAAWEAGDVTLMHDIWGGIYVRALPVILDDLASRGIGTSTICEPVEIMPVPAVG
ncbi:MAG: polysaccharide deacetylase family protein, partial [Actinobacteria bacterium]|nr:polysaccharide deacetylase family protein [Actinomycetota bacterium]